MYAEVVNEITRGDDTITANAIAAAEQETKMYLGRYDLTALFGTEGEAPTVADAYLTNLVKDIACHYLLRPATGGAEQELYQRAYDDAIAALKKIQDGSVQPMGWPYAPVPGTPLPDGNTISWSSKPKRNNHY